MELINLAIVEDDKVIRESLINYLNVHPSINLVINAESIESYLQQIKDQNVPTTDVLLLDIGLPGMTGIEGIRHIRKYYEEVDIVMLTTFEEDDMIFKALCAGACSYMSKRTPLAKIREAVFTIYRGGSYMSPSIARKVAMHFMPKVQKEENAILTPRQQEIVSAIVDGLSYKMIADKLGISLDTVRDHIKRIYRALQINSKAELIRKSLEGEI